MNWTSRGNPGGPFFEVAMSNWKLLIILFLASSALADEDALLQCRQVESIEERVACYDRYVDSTHPKDAVTAVRIPDAQSLFGEHDSEAKQIVAEALSIEQIDQVLAEVANVSRSASRKLVVTLENGQVWQQVDSQALHLKEGDAVVIRKASLGSYRLEKESGSRRIRVRRLN